MIEPVYVDVQKVAGMQAVDTRHLDSELRRFAQDQIRWSIEKLVGRWPDSVRFEESRSIQEIEPDLRWWQRALRALGRSYPPTILDMTMIVGYAFGCHHPFTNEWIETNPSAGRTSIAFLPPGKLYP